MRTKEEIIEDFQKEFCPKITAHDSNQKLEAEVVAEFLKVSKTETFVKLLDEYAQAYSRERFEKAMVEEANDDNLKTISKEVSLDFEDDWNACRSEIIKRFNAYSSEVKE